MPINHTVKQKKILNALPQDRPLTETADASQAKVQVLGLELQEDIGERIYTVLIRDPLNLEKPVAAILSVFPDGTVQAQEDDLEEIDASYDIEV